MLASMTSAFTALCVLRAAEFSDGDLLALLVSLPQIRRQRPQMRSRRQRKSLTQNLGFSASVDRPCRPRAVFNLRSGLVEIAHVKIAAIWPLL